MNKPEAHVIRSVAPGSIAEELEIVPGDSLLSINSTPIEDILDYRFLIQNEELTLLILKKNGTEEEWEIEKDFYDDLGIEFESGLMSDYRHCSNNCIFCFIDQMPPGMRETLYFKDDDARLSFLQGNYITMTNMKLHDIDRIIRYRLSPINISVHTTNPELRIRMLHNRFAGDIMEKLVRLRDGDITMNSQIVLCPGFNDGEELSRTIRDLSTLYPQMQSLSVVPIGLTKYRDNLTHVDPVTKEIALDTIRRIQEVSDDMMAKYGSHFVHASDELYLTAELPIPEEDSYDGYIQLENGVGMIRLLLTEAKDALEDLAGDGRVRKISTACGRLIAPFIRKIADDLQRKFPGVSVTVHAIRNDFFGERITVSGLITGQDLIAQLSGCDLGECLLLPVEMFRSGEEVFLDDITRADLERALQVPVDIVKSDGQALIDAILGTNKPDHNSLLHSPYEPERL